MLISLSEMITKYKMNITGVIHIGAHYGEEIPEYIKNGISELHLFEPLSENYKILRNNLQDLEINWASYNTALGSKNERVTMFVSDNEQQSSSILTPKDHLTHHPNVRFPTTEEVVVDTLDSFEIENCNFINMDVQGYELEVLKGATETLEHIDYVYCEVNRAEVYENNAFVEEIDEFLSQYNMIRVETDWAGEIWGDALYVRTER
jgi:FkbM family methyltransferase